MGKHSARSRIKGGSSEAVQMVLAIEDPPVRVAVRPRKRVCQNPQRRDRDLGMDPILYMRDVVQIVGKHRSTILRWIDHRSFPPKSVPRDHPSGWLRSEIESWQRGEVSAVASARNIGGDHAGDKPGRQRVK
jgi:predicted DNA-binding transcriptional regulator AlpA